MDKATPTFVPSASIRSSRPYQKPLTCCVTCNCCKGSGRVSRRTVLRRGFLAATSFLIGASNPSFSNSASAADEPSSDEVCKNCNGIGKVPCELCAGTGFWRALSGNDPKQKYKGVVCPECEGTGILTCPVCLGTGEGNVRGLLRRRRIEPGPGRILQTN